MAADCDGKTSCTWGGKKALTYGDPDEGVEKAASYSWTCNGGATETRSQAAEASESANFDISCPCTGGDGNTPATATETATETETETATETVTETATATAPPVCGADKQEPQYKAVNGVCLPSCGQLGANAGGYVSPTTLVCAPYVKTCSDATTHVSGATTYTDLGQTWDCAANSCCSIS
jgi:hypothetical protein